MTYFIDIDLDTEFADEGQWRSYQFTAEGESLQDLLESATVSETDQDGGEIDTYALEDARNDVIKEVYSVIENTIKRSGRV